MKIARGEGIERRQGLGGSVQASLAFDCPALVDDGDDARPSRCTEARPADDLPRTHPRLQGRLVDADARVGVAVE